VMRVIIFVLLFVFLASSSSSSCSVPSRRILSIPLYTISVLPRRVIRRGRREGGLGGSLRGLLLLLFRARRIRRSRGRRLELVLLMGGRVRWRVSVLLGKRIRGVMGSGHERRSGRRAKRKDLAEKRRESERAGEISARVRPQGDR
jgi:hypothetical protein